jgi:polyhydroxyalkanoate synthesis regulator phasin
MSYIDDIHKKVNDIYASRKCNRAIRPCIQSDQVMSLMEVLTEEIDKLRGEMYNLKEEIRSLKEDQS